MAEDYAREIEEFDLICFFCAQPFEEELVNSECELNKTKKTDSDQKQNTGRVHSRLGRKSCSLRPDSDVRADPRSQRSDWEGFTTEKPSDVFFGNNRWGKGNAD